MIQSKQIIIGLVAVIFIISCAHGTKRGSVAMKVSDKEAHVSLGKDDVKMGDILTLFKNECNTHSGGDSTLICNKVRLGSAEVSQPINEEYSIIQVEPGVQFNEGTIVEKN